MYYRIAVQTYAPPALRWQSDPLCSLSTVVQWLLTFCVFPPERLRVFSSEYRDGLDEQLRHVNDGLDSTSVRATRLVSARASVPPALTPIPLAPRPTAAKAGHTVTERLPSHRQPLMSASLDLRRNALECGPSGDHDILYRFIMPTSTPEVLAWARLLARVQHGVLRVEVAVLADA